MTQGVHSINSASQLISDKTQKITIVDYDIEHFNKVDKMERYNDRKYIVFIDAYMPFHPDFELTASGHIDPEQYFKSVNNYLKRVEDKYGLPVVIAAHPSAQKISMNITILTADPYYLERLRSCVRVVHGLLII